MTKKKQQSSVDLLIQGIKGLHPMFQGMLIDRIEKDIKSMTKHLPEIIEHHTTNETMFHPNFFIDYINEMNTIIDFIEFNSLTRWDEQQSAVFKSTPKIERITE